jgi:hypothetical protein
MDRIEGGDVSRSRLDQAGIGPHATGAADLVPLRNLHEIRVAEGDPDIRGWEVVTLSGTKVGTVDELLVDRARGEVVMLDIDLAGSDRHTLAPIRAVQIDRARRVVIIDSADLKGPADVAALSRGEARAAPTEVAAPRDDNRVRLTDARVADAAVSADRDEVVVERRPVVYEEVVVRRRAADPSAPAPEKRTDVDH